MPSSTEDSPTPPATSQEDLGHHEHINDDDREKLNWQSRWPTEAQKEIFCESTYVAIVFIGTLVAIIFTIRGDVFNLLTYNCTSCSFSRERLDSFVLFFLGGTLGGILFSIKYLYQVVARGFWNIDRRLWRIFSPFTSGALALAIGVCIDSGLMGLTIKTDSMSSFFSIGFISGYFADNALAKMQEIAETIFGRPDLRSSEKKKKNSA